MTSVAAEMPRPVSTSHLVAEWIIDSRPVNTAVRAALGETNNKQAALIPDLIQVIAEYLRSNKDILFGEGDWERLVGRVTPAPTLPPNIEAILQGPCPFFSGKEVRETHLLVYMPTTVNGQSLTLNILGLLAKRHFFPASETSYRYIGDDVVKELGDMPLAKSSWVLMTKDVLPESRSKSYAEQQYLVTTLATRANIAYEVPKTLEAAVCILTHYISVRTCLFSKSPWTFARCQENVHGSQMVVGGFSPSGLFVNFNSSDNNRFGVATLRRFF